MKNYIVERKVNLSLHLIKSTQLPKSEDYTVICITKYDDIDHLDIVDDIENGGKKAVLNTQKVATKDALIAAKKAQWAADYETDIAERASVKAIDVDSMIDSNEKDNLKELLKYLIKKLG